MHANYGRRGRKNSSEFLAGRPVVAALASEQVALCAIEWRRAHNDAAAAAVIEDRTGARRRPDRLTDIMQQQVCLMTVVVVSAPVAIARDRYRVGQPIAISPRRT